MHEAFHSVAVHKLSHKYAKLCLVIKFPLRRSLAGVFAINESSVSLDVPRVKHKRVLSGSVPACHNDGKNQNNTFTMIQ